MPPANPLSANRRLHCREEPHPHQEKSITTAPKHGAKANGQGCVSCSGECPQRDRSECESAAHPGRDGSQSGQPKAARPERRVNDPYSGKVFRSGGPPPSPSSTLWLTLATPSSLFPAIQAPPSSLRRREPAGVGTHADPHLLALYIRSQEAPGLSYSHRSSSLKDLYSMG